jgi:hypothetical protein
MIEKEGIERMNEEQDRQKQDSRSERRYREKDVEKRRSRGGEGAEEIKEIRTDREVWKYINQEKKQKESALEGRKEEGTAGTQMKGKQMAPEEAEITAEDMVRQIRKLKKRNVL